LMEGEIIGKLQTSAFQDCLQQCSKQKKCTAVNFLLGVQEDPVCLFIDRTKEGNKSEMPIPESVIYSAVSFCFNQKLSSQCTDSTTWSFEKFPNKDLIDDRKQCRAVLYNEKVAQCRYLNVSIQNVHSAKKFFKRSVGVDLYENNCFPENLIMNIAQCQFIRMQSSGFTEIFDERIANVSSAIECEQLCLTWDSVKLKCKPDRMQIHGASLKMFSGTLMTKNNKIVSCEKRFFHVYEFDAEILYNECGMQKALFPYLTFSNLVMLKEGSTELITVKDKLLKVVCRIHNDLEIPPVDQHLSFHLRNEDGNITKQILAKNIQISPQLRSYVTQPRYTMEVMDANRNPAEVVQIGDEGYLLLTLHDKPIKFSIIDLFARDTQSGRTFTIIDSDGCAVPNGMLKNTDRIDKNHLQLTLVFNGFSDEADIIYEAYAIPCDEFCGPNSCNKMNSIKNQQTKRSVTTQSESRLFELSGDIYAVKSSNKLKLRKKSWKIEAANFLESNDIRPKSVVTLYEQSLTDVSDSAEGKSTTVNQLVCITEDVKCLIVFLALCLQALVLVAIIAVTYTTIQHWMRQQKNPEIVGLSRNIDNKQETIRRLSRS
uniref:ZP domain-containing protein n=1 Tax=Brugia timori TaxID=42155 RepID=A0A0R3QRR1_9BILA